MERKQDFVFLEKEKETSFKQLMQNFQNISIKTFYSTIN